MYWWIRRRCSLKWVHFLTIKKLCKQTTNFKYKRVFFIFSINEHQYLYIYANHKLQIELTRFRIFERLRKNQSVLARVPFSKIESQTNKQKQSVLEWKSFFLLLLCSKEYHNGRQKRTVLTEVCASLLNEQWLSESFTFL